MLSTWTLDEEVIYASMVNSGHIYVKPEIIYSLYYHFELTIFPALKMISKKKDCQNQKHLWDKADM